MDEDYDRGLARSLREPQITDIAAVWPVPDGCLFPHENRTVVATAGSSRFPGRSLRTCPLTRHRAPEMLRPNRAPCPRWASVVTNQLPFLWKPLNGPRLEKPKRVSAGWNQASLANGAGRDRATSARACNMASVFDCDVDVKTGPGVEGCHAAAS